MWASPPVRATAERFFGKTRGGGGAAGRGHPALQRGQDDAGIAPVRATAERFFGKTRRGGAGVLCVRQAAATKYWRKRSRRGQTMKSA